MLAPDFFVLAVGATLWSCQLTAESSTAACHPAVLPGCILTMLPVYRTAPRSWASTAPPPPVELWCGTSSGQIVICAPAATTWPPSPFLPVGYLHGDGPISALCQINSGQLLAGGTNGELLLIDIERRHVITALHDPEPSLDNQTVSSIVVLPPTLFRRRPLIMSAGWDQVVRIFTVGFDAKYQPEQRNMMGEYF
jgi:hypothetical protein